MRSKNGLNVWLESQSMMTKQNQIFALLKSVLIPPSPREVLDEGKRFQLGGTIGDIESMPFVEAFRQFQFRVKKENFCVVHVSLVPQVSVNRLVSVPSSILGESISSPVRRKNTKPNLHNTVSKNYEVTV